ncbi:hypothetical protein HK096_008242, partial [Nowakowskiella sp. JEL0078]
KQLGYKVPKHEPEDEKAEKLRIEEQAKIDESEPLLDEEIEEKDNLSKSGLENWKREDFKLFLKGCEKYGRDQLDLIASEIDGKTIEEVTEYSKVFWERCTELADYEKIVGNIERGELKLQKIVEVQEALGEKLAMYRAPLQQLRLSYGTVKGRVYTEDEDRFLLLLK